MFKKLKFFNYFRLLGILYFLIGLQLTFRTSNITILKYIGMFLIIVSIYNIVTGTSMKSAALNKNPVNDSVSSENTEVPSEQINLKSTNSKGLYLKFLKGNAMLSAITLLIAFTLFMSSKPIAKYIFESNVKKYQDSKSLISNKEIPAINDVTSTKLNNCTIKLYNDKVTLTASSIESRSNTTIVNVTIENKSKKQLNFTTSKFLLQDEKGNKVKLSSEPEFIRLLLPIDENSSNDRKFTFEAAKANSKIKKLSGSLWILDGGVKEIPFTMEFK